MPTVSVIIPTYNRAAMLMEAIESVLAQTYQDWELIVVDDGSTDDTVSLVEALASRDPRIRLIRQENRGLAEARNTGIRASRGTYLAFLDDDDLWLPEKLALQVRCMNGPTRPGLSFTLTYSMAPDGTIARVVPEAPGQTYTELFLHNFVPCPSVMVRRDCVEYVGGFDKSMNPAEDYDMWLRIAREAPIDFVPYPVVIYRRHGNNMSDNTLAIYRADLHILRRLVNDPLLVIGRSERRRRLAAVYYEMARRAIDHRFWKSACWSLIQALACSPEIGLFAKRYASRSWFYHFLKPYPAVGYCLLHWVWGLQRPIR